MIDAMLAREIEGEVQAVANIEITSEGFTFKTKDLRLTRILEEIQEKGVWDIVDGYITEDGEEEGDLYEFVKITEATASVLCSELLDNGYHWWEGPAA